MPTSSLLPAAQYLRMSTEHQQYSLRNQAMTIRDYASRCGFKIARTYSDAGRSGLVLKNRPALSSLLRDVVSGNAAFCAVLVYDISRWGRFQDTDEAAHYEFLCKSAGIPIHYCAEQFANDGSISSLIMKSLKRAMAGEYSRELGTKVYTGQKRIAQLGFHVGGRATYGLRRMLLSSHGRRRMLLRLGQHKSLTTDRIILVPGPRREQQIVREIFASRLQGETATSIARRLNARGIPYLQGRKWNVWSLVHLLKNPKYAGCNCWGRTSQRLSVGTKRMPQESWTMSPNAFTPLVSWETFQRVQKLLADPCKYTDEEMLDGLRRLLAEKGRLSERLISEAPSLPCPTQYGRRFGSTRRAYQLIGYEQFVELTSAEQRVHSIKLRNELIATIMGAACGNVRLAKRDESRRPHLIVNEQFRVCVLVCPSRPTKDGQLRWVYYPVEKESACMKLACALDESNTRIKRMYVLKSHRLLVSAEGSLQSQGSTQCDALAFGFETQMPSRSAGCSARFLKGPQENWGFPPALLIQKGSVVAGPRRRNCGRESWCGAATTRLQAPPQQDRDYCLQLAANRTVSVHKVISNLPSGLLRGLTRTSDKRHTSV